MSDVPESDIWPDRLMRDFLDGCVGTRDVDMMQTLHAIIEDVLDSVELAISDIDLSEYDKDQVLKEVTDYVNNHYWDQ